MQFSELFQSKIGPDGEVEFVPKGSRKDPWISKRLDRCPVCFVRGTSRRGKKIDSATFESGNTKVTYECRVCHHRWVWDKRVSHWTRKQLQEYRRILRREGE
jgi:hypothetical protein